MPSVEDGRVKRDKFIEFYLGEAQGNQSKAAVMAGYSKARAGITACELMKDPYVLDKIKKATDVKRDFTTDNIESIEDIFATSGPALLKVIAEAAKSDPDQAQKFLKLKLDYEKRKTEVLGEYEGLSTQEIIGRFNTCIERGREIISRIVETAGTGEMQAGLDVLIIGSPSEQRPKTESVGNDTPSDTGPTSVPDIRRPGTIPNTTGTLEVNSSNPELDTPTVNQEPNIENTDSISEPEESQGVPGSDKESD